MNKNNNSNTETPLKPWNGVTLEELRFMLASALIKLEMQKDYMKKKMSQTLPMQINGKNGLVNGIASKLSFAQKIILAIKGVKLATSIITFLRRK